MTASRLAALQGALAFTTLIGLLAVATAPARELVLHFAGYLALASAVSAAAARMLARGYAEALARALAHVSRLGVAELGPRGATDATLVAQSIAGLEQVAGLWPLAAAGAGVSGLLASILSYYIARRGAAALLRLAKSLGAEPACRSPPGLSVAAVSSITLAGLGASAVIASPSYGRLLRCIEEAGEELRRSLESRAAPAEAGEDAGAAAPGPVEPVDGEGKGAGEGL
ncbi:hypothetical protein CF15_01935 [Pyrodictium occultum]|uniref:Uncharacterized protein n=1 Tax=Pyrodictium occultum TaxID=2309 RepID=A0A0V8RUE7_PYROC|nr:hypothetical protein [Pyrodictium occultum]KSW11613.1 hypothetical protein CF15_01935 [Pyrodictium occultum]